MDTNDELCEFEDRLCPFKDKCDPKCALYLGGARRARGDCVFTWIDRELEKIRNELKHLHENIPKP